VLDGDFFIFFFPLRIQYSHPSPPMSFLAFLPFNRIFDKEGDGPFPVTVDFSPGDVFSPQDLSPL